MKIKADEQLVICPTCKHKFDINATFWWGHDINGDPTLENAWCPKCGVSTEQIMQCSWCPGKALCDLEEECAACHSVNFDEFKSVSTRRKDTI